MGKRSEENPDDPVLSETTCARKVLVSAVLLATGLAAGAAQAATRILFVGNSFTYGALA